MLGDFAAMCWWATWHQTSPQSHFSRSLVCSLPTETGRVTLSDRTLVRTEDGRRDEPGRRDEHDTRDERMLTDDADVLAAYRTYFGISLDRVPSVRPPAFPS